jgi:hypothetical protein
MLVPNVRQQADALDHVHLFQATEYAGTRFEKDFAAVPGRISEIAL